jgi:hypothetical protein
MCKKTKAPAENPVNIYPGNLLPDQVILSSDQGFDPDQDPCTGKYKIKRVNFFIIRFLMNNKLLGQYFEFLLYRV